MKYALHLALGLSADIRLPLPSVQPETAGAIREAMLILAENDSNVFRSRRAVVGAGYWGPNAPYRTVTSKPETRFSSVNLYRNFISFLSGTSRIFMVF
ncbi:hypothetical protein ABID19_005663 [Mesorhizobium robiniae]|uniref:Uncharacterized protein n=1 Tax=Mesorhizobium robiniae TaxID=559315 RepID=A0ABV2GWD8_9HYPH